MWRKFNPNPIGRRVGDCAIRAVAAAEGLSWDEAFDQLAAYGKKLGNLQNSNEAIGAYLKDRGYTRHIIPDSCPACYTVADFCRDHPIGIYVLGTGSHTVTAIDGDAYDSWNSLDEVPIYYWEATDEL